jgi:hypothetical protein
LLLWEFYHTATITATYTHLDEPATHGIYDFSIVGAHDREDAVIQPDEWGNAEQAQLWPVAPVLYGTSSPLG